MLKEGHFEMACIAVLCLLGTGFAEVSAQIGQRPADQYIASMDNPRRVAGLKIDEVIELLGLEAGDVVADIGSGSGVFSIPMARAIGPTGVLYPVDIDQEMLDFVVERAEGEGLRNVRAVLGEFDDPKLPVNDVDVVFIHRTLHMIEHRQAYVNAVMKYLKPDGRIAIVEAEQEDVRNWMWMRQSDVDTWMAANSFYPAESFDLFDNRWFVVYQRPYGDSSLLRRR